MTGTAAQVAFDSGHGAPALVFLHYFGGSGRCWMQVADGLASHCRCVALDVPGFGGSPDSPEPSVAAMAEALEAAIATVSGPIVLVGHSMGGKIAMVLAGRRPVWLRGLVLVAPSPPTPEPMSEQDRAAALQAFADPAAAAATLRRITRRTLTPEVMAEQVADHGRVSSAAWRWWLAQGSRETILDAAAAIAVPTLVIGGAEDPVIGPDLAAAIAASIHSATLMLVPECGHLLPLEAPAEVAHALAAFISRTDDDPSTKRVCSGGPAMA